MIYVRDILLLIIQYLANVDTIHFAMSCRTIYYLPEIHEKCVLLANSYQYTCCEYKNRNYCSYKACIITNLNTIYYSLAYFRNHTLIIYSAILRELNTDIIKTYKILYKLNDHQIKYRIPFLFNTHTYYLIVKNSNPKILYVKLHYGDFVLTVRGIYIYLIDNKF